MSAPEGQGAPEREGAPPGTAAASIARWGLVALMAGVAIASVVHVYGTSSPSAPAAGIAASPGAGAATRYHCPMHPQIVRDRPGECPICQMTLVPVETSTAGRDATATGARATPALGALAPLQLSPERVQLAGIKIAPVVRRRLGGELAAAGVVAENERGLAAVSTRFAGWIQDLLVAETGRRVTKGQALATIYSPDVLSAEQEFLTARRWAAPSGAPPAAGPHAHETLTAGMADDARKRLDLLGVSPQEIDEIARTGQARHAVTVRSPANGTVIRRGAVAGGYVQPGSELFAIADLSTVWFVAEVYEHDMARVRVGQAARIELAGLPGRLVKGRVQFLYPSVSAETRTMRVRVEVANPGGELRPGMFGTMHVDLPGGPALAVPADAVVDTGDAQYLFVAKPGGRFEPRAVKIGARGDGFVEITDGVADGEEVVTTANFLIDSESRLRAAIEGAR